MKNYESMVKSTLINRHHSQSFPKQFQIPSQFQIQSMFQKNGFHINNVVTRSQLKQLFDRQYALNNLQQYSQNQKFSEQLFDQLWGQLQTLSDSTVKIQNVCEVLYQAMKILRDRLYLIDGPEGISFKQKELQQLRQKQIELTQQMDMVDAQFDYHQQKIKSQRNAIRMTMGKTKAQIQQLQRDKQSFQFQLKILLMTIGEHKDAAIQTKVIEQNVMSMFGLQKKTLSNDLKFIFILTIVCFILELYILSYRNSFFNILGMFFILHVLFLGYYNDKSVVYIIIYIVLSIILDLGFVALSMFTKFILSPIVYTYNGFLKYISMLLIIVSVIGRLILIIKLIKYKEIPKNSQYFMFWGEEVVLNRRCKRFSNNNVAASRIMN